LDDLIQAGNGIVTVSALRDAGLSSGHISHLTRKEGGWTWLYPGVYATFKGGLQPLQRLRAALIYAGRGAVVTGHWALVLRGVERSCADEPIHLLIPHSTRRKEYAGLRIERTTMAPGHAEVNGFLVAEVPRAVIDACRHSSSADRVRHLIGLALRLRRATVQHLVDELARANRKGSALAREALGAAACGVRGAEETRLRARMLAAGLLAPAWNVHLYDPAGNWVAYVDGYLAGIAFEMQSRAFHLYIDRWEPDVARLSRLNSYGVMVQLATPRFLRNNWPEFEADVRRALGNGVGDHARLAVGPPPPWWGSRAA
jgi:hypothetical protein